MGKFEITSSTTNSNFTYKDDNVVVSGSFQKDVTNNNDLQSINGTAYHINAQGEQGEYIGNFNGNVRDGEIRYSLSEMSRKDSNKVWDAIDEIELNVVGDGE